MKSKNIDYMQHTFDYLENVAFAATVCDKHGVVLYQNARARKRDGGVVGQNLYDCHGKKSQAMIRHMMETGESNTYEIIRHGHRRLLHQTPWFEQPGGEVAGLVELSVDLPDEYVVLDRDK